MAISRRPGYYQARDQAWKPLGTYTLLGVIGAVWGLQHIVLLTSGNDLHRFLFVVAMDWMHRPWTLVTATLSHAPFFQRGGLFHILFNGMILYFFGPILERIMGVRWFVVWFFVAGALASILQSYLTWVLYGIDPGGLGASGALMMVFGALMVLMPKQTILLFGIVPLPFWLAGLGFALLDILGAMNPLSGIGNFAHLSGMAIGLAWGFKIRADLKRRGLVLATG